MGNHPGSSAKLEGITEDIHKTYKIHEKLGTGNFATVKRAVHKKTKVSYAVKEIKLAKLDKKDMESVHLEVDIMKGLQHPNICLLIETFQSSKKLYIVLELLEDELFDRIVNKGSFSEKEASTVMRTMTEAIQYLHSKKVVHRDLKPENVIYASKAADAQIKITDFGLAKHKVDQEVQLHTACGTPGYVAPEVLKEDPHYGPPVDLWSLGVILYILLCGMPPFYAQETKQLFKRIKKGQYDFPSPYWDKISAEAKDVVNILLVVKPENRATPERVLAHPWIVGNATLSKAPLNVIGGLQIMQAKRRLRKGIAAIIAMNRLVDALKENLAE